MKKLENKGQILGQGLRIEQVGSRIAKKVLLTLLGDCNEMED